MGINDETKLLLHVCCAPCSGVIIERLLAQGVMPTVFFYNPNIFPLKEYLFRKDSIIKFAKKNSIPFVDTDYENSLWKSRVAGLDNEPERGRRCEKCFDIRLERTALYAHENGFKAFATTNGMSRWKDLAQVNLAGLKAAARYPEVVFWDKNWRKNNGEAQMYAIAKKEHFYRQEYCGCEFSLAAANALRQKQGLPSIEPCESSIYT
ncbi:MAG: epoxyqueuosine reductase QueH [Candidatus Omnitrophica bacterium]|nr:epoxyqueuosine reductase QueH [Candidatus Omnitrophota bacterium]